MLAYNIWIQILASICGCLCQGSLQYGTIFSPLYLDGPSHICPHCGAPFWSEERVRGQGRRDAPVYNKCRRGGSIVLPPYKPPPEPLFGLLTGHSKLSNHFLKASEATILCSL